MVVGHFLAGISAVIYSPNTSHYLLLHRAEEKDYAAGAWECLTGRVDQGEGFQDALHREVHEELGITVQVVSILGTTHFFRGSPIPENELVGVVFLCLHNESSSIKISDEHSEFRWLDYQHSVHLLSAPDPSTQWAHRVIERAQAILTSLPGELLDFLQAEGLEFG